MLNDDVIDIDIPQSESKMEDFPNRLVPDIPTDSGRSEKSFSTVDETGHEQQQKNQESKASTNKFLQNRS